MCGERYGERSNDNDRRMPECEEKTDGDRSFSFEHQFAGHIVDRRKMVRIERVPQPEAVSQQCGSDEDRLMGERNKRPGPGQRVARDEKCVDADDPLAKSLGATLG